MTVDSVQIPPLGPAVEALFPRANASWMPLGSGSPRRDVREFLERLQASDLLPQRKIVERSMAEGCLAGLWLYHGFLDESHSRSQEIETPSGSYWHGIMHRREPDPDNAKYWFRRVGQHPIFPALAQSASAWITAESATFAASIVDRSGAWNPLRFIDLCESARLGQGPDAAVAFCERLQHREWELLFLHCLTAAYGL